MDGGIFKFLYTLSGAQRCQGMRQSAASLADAKLSLAALHALRWRTINPAANWTKAYANTSLSEYSTVALNKQDTMIRNDGSGSCKCDHCQGCFKHLVPDTLPYKLSWTLDDLASISALARSGNVLPLVASQRLPWLELEGQCWDCHKHKSSFVCKVCYDWGKHSLSACISKLFHSWHRWETPTSCLHWYCPIKRLLCHR